jgi:WD40-like Beta Propeller Repeat
MARISHTRSCVPRINLNHLSGSGVRLTPYEAVAVVHQVCELMKASDQRGHPLAPPTIDQLFVTETGDIGIEPRPPGRAAQAPRALSQLVDELLPANRVASEILSPAPAHVYGSTTSHARHATRSGANAAIVNPGDERAVLRHLFDRAQDELDAPGPIEPPPHAVDTVSPPVLPVEPTAHSPRIAVVFEDASDLAFAAEVERATQQAEHAAPDGDTRPHLVADVRSSIPSHFFDAPAPAAPTVAVTHFPVDTVLDVDTQREQAQGTAGRPFFDGVAQGGTRVEVLAPVNSRQTRRGGLADSTVTRHFVSRYIVAASLCVGIIALLASPIGLPLRAQLVAALAERPDVESTPNIDRVAAPLVRTGDQPAAEPRRADVRQSFDRPSVMPAIALSSSPATPAEIESLRAVRSGSGAEPFEGARISPDGRMVAYVDQRDDGPRGIYVAPRDGEGGERVSGAHRAASPSWSPDSSWLAFVAAEPERPEIWNVWAYEISSGTLRRLSSHNNRVARAATWFPASDRLAYSHGTSLVIVTIASAQAAEYHSPVRGRAPRASAVSPDGRAVALSLERDGVWLLDVERGRMRRIVEDPEVSDDLKWLGDSGRLAYYRLRPDGGWRTWRGATEASSAGEDGRTMESARR